MNKLLFKANAAFIFAAALIFSACGNTTSSSGGGTNLEKEKESEKPQADPPAPDAPENPNPPAPKPKPKPDASIEGFKLLLSDKTYTANGVSFAMKAIQEVKGGVIGNNEQQYNKEATVNLTAYRIGETEVTQQLWKAVMGEGKNYSHFKDNPKQGEVQESRPVDSVSWNDCIEFCNELTKIVFGA